MSEDFIIIDDNRKKCICGHDVFVHNEIEGCTAGMFIQQWRALISCQCMSTFEEI